MVLHSIIMESSSSTKPEDQSVRDDVMLKKIEGFRLNPNATPYIPSYMQVSVAKSHYSATDYSLWSPFESAERSYILSKYAHIEEEPPESEDKDSPDEFEEEPKAIHRFKLRNVERFNYKDFRFRVPNGQKSDLRSFIENGSKSQVFCNKYVAHAPHISIQFSDESGAARIVENAQRGSNYTTTLSEAISCELLYRLVGAQLTLTELEVEYVKRSGIRKTDYVAKVFGRSVAVSVTRAFAYKSSLTHDEALALLQRKFASVLSSNEGVTDRHRWERQILHVWAADRTSADSVLSAFSCIHRNIETEPIAMILTLTDFPSCPLEYAYLYSSLYG